MASQPKPLAKSLFILGGSDSKCVQFQKRERALWDRMVTHSCFDSRSRTGRYRVAAVEIGNLETGFIPEILRGLA